ncbi:MAG: HAMP domain-containing protein [Candidatus Aceula meridiana]|nr:HAMP domain-containing protein [Candidatus Aceula meridiana]
MSTGKIIRRKNYFIKKKFQTNFIIKFCILVILSTIISGVVLYSSSLNTATTAFVNSRLEIVRTSDYIIPNLMLSSFVSIVLVGLATIVVVIFLSHRIAGALFNIERSVSDAADGDLTRRIHLRSKDEVTALADSFNRMIQITHEKILKIKFHSDSLQQDLDEISKALSEDNKKKEEEILAILKRLKDKKSSLDSVIRAFKINDV